MVILGAIVVWGFWTLSGTLLATIVPSTFQARSAALQIVVIGVALSTVLLLRPRGLLGELRTVSRFLDP